MRQSWEQHYKKEKSLLSYPDENLVRMLALYLREQKNTSDLIAIDLGCGTGRHLKLLEDFNMKAIGADFSFNALSSCTKAGFKNLINCNNENLPFKDSSIDIIISWGSLHYCDKDNMIKMLSQIHRVLKRGGRLLATLRKDSDTYLKKGKHIQNNTWITELGDLKGSVVSFFSQEELKSLFKIFNNVQYGWMERTLIGDVDKVIAHWVISAEK